MPHDPELSPMKRQSMAVYDKDFSTGYVPDSADQNEPLSAEERELLESIVSDGILLNGHEIPPTGLSMSDIQQSDRSTR